MRIGHGYDVHRYKEGRKLIIGGCEIPFSMGLDGHSDADVLCHAIMDSLLGAAAQGDIGKIFPDSDDRFHDACSLDLLKEVGRLLKAKGFSVINIDSTVVAQKPRLADFIFQMRSNIASALEIDVSAVSVKATTEEKLGFTGRCEGVAAHAVCLIE